MARIPVKMNLLRPSHALLSRKLASTRERETKPTQGGRPWPPKEALPPRKTVRALPKPFVAPTPPVPFVAPTPPPVALPSITHGSGSIHAAVDNGASTPAGLLDIDLAEVLEEGPASTKKSEMPPVVMYGGIALALGVVYLLATRKK